MAGAITALVAAAAAAWVGLDRIPKDSRVHFVLANLLDGAATPAELGDGGPPAEIRLGDPMGLAMTPGGAVYLSDRGRSGIGRVIWRIGDGAARVVAGTGRKGRPAVGGSARASDLGSPEAVALAPDGSLVFADSTNSTVLAVGPDGVLRRLAGSGRRGYGGDGGPATAADLNQPFDVSLGPDGTLYIADFANHRIRAVGPEGRIRTFAGTGEPGYDGDGGPAAAARLNGPYGVLALPDGSVVIADSLNNVVRRVGRDGIIETIAGTGEAGYAGDGGPATKALLRAPEALRLDADGSTLLVGDEHNFSVRALEIGGNIRTLFGDGQRGSPSERALTGAIRFTDPEGILPLGPGGGYLVSDGDNRRVWLLGPDGSVEAFAGRPPR